MRSHSRRFWEGFSQASIASLSSLSSGALACAFARASSEHRASSGGTEPEHAPTRTSSPGASCEPERLNTACTRLSTAVLVSASRRTLVPLRCRSAACTALASTVVLPVPGGPWISEMGRLRVASTARCWLALSHDMGATAEPRQGAPHSPAEDGDPSHRVTTVGVLSNGRTASHTWERSFCALRWSHRCIAECMRSNGVC
mmetsp:Transcript_21302/g.68685  ORF Transcript_21302/g.68685 Transcript_21302/m.68685 type:complete len:201 (+) Transcript_21302:135-737(+)